MANAQVFTCNYGGSIKNKLLKSGEKLFLKLEDGKISGKAFICNEEGRNGYIDNFEYPINDVREVYKGDYQGAAEAYENAVKYAPGNDINIGNYYLDYAMALAECGEYMQARDKISLAGNSVSQSSIYLLDAKIALLSGDLNGCTEKVNAILSLPGSADECAQACMIQAQCIGERTVNGIAWMERALQYKQDSEGLRALATNCLAVAGMCENTSDKRTFIEKAKQYYARLVSEADATEEDWLGYAVTLYVAGDRNNCSTILQRYASAGSTDEEETATLYSLAEPNSFSAVVARFSAEP